MTSENVTSGGEGPAGNGTPCVLYGAQSKARTEGDPSESPVSQGKNIEAKLPSDRFKVGALHIDYASGSKTERGPGLAAAIEEATAAAERYGTAELWVYHSSRLARGSGKKGHARALGRLLYELQANGVTVRSVTDDEYTTNEMLWGFASRQAAKYAEDLSAHVTRGYREAAERGSAAWLARGIQIGGYQVLRSFDRNGRVVHEAIKHPEDAWIYELIFEMALAGRSALAIQLELSARGAMTRPSRKDHKPRPFDIGRVSQVLDNPTYAGLLVHKGEIVGPGDWPRYVEPEDFHRLRAERAERWPAAKRTVGRPPVGYMLSGLAVCGICFGPCRVKTTSGGVRRYVCAAHLDYHRDSPQWCPALPFDATQADKLVLSGIDSLLADADALRTGLDAGRATDIERMGKIAAAAREDAAKADRVAAKAQARYERALAEDDDETAEITLSIARNKRDEAKHARERLDAALDALNADPEPNEGDVLERIWQALSGRVADADGNIKKLNAVLREWFARFELERQVDGLLRIVPILSPAAVARILHEPDISYPHQVRLEDNIRAVSFEGKTVQIGYGTIRNPPPLTDANNPLTSQNASTRPSKATMSSSPQRVR